MHVRNIKTLFVGQHSIYIRRHGWTTATSTRSAANSPAYSYISPLPRWFAGFSLRQHDSMNCTSCTCRADKDGNSFIAVVRIGLSTLESKFCFLTALRMTKSCVLSLGWQWRCPPECPLGGYNIGVKPISSSSSWLAIGHDVEISDSSSNRF